MTSPFQRAKEITGVDLSEQFWMLRRHVQTNPPSNYFELIGPMTTPEFVLRLQSRENILLTDEVCASGGYWFTLKDAQEVRDWLGDAVLEQLHPNSKDREQTQRDIDGDDTATDLDNPAPTSRRTPPLGISREDPTPEMTRPDSSGDLDAADAETGPQSYRPRPSLFGTVFYLSIVAATLVFLLLMKLIRGAGG